MHGILLSPCSSITVSAPSQKSSSPDLWRREGVQEQERQKQRGLILRGQPVLMRSLLVILGWGQGSIQISLQDAGFVGLCQCPCVPRNLMHAERHQKGNTNHALNKLGHKAVARARLSACTTQFQKDAAFQRGMSMLLVLIPLCCDTDSFIDLEELCQSVEEGTSLIETRE